MHGFSRLSLGCLRRRDKSAGNCSFRSQKMIAEKPNWIRHEGMQIFSIDIQPGGLRFATGGGDHKVVVGFFFFFHLFLFWVLLFWLNLLGWFFYFFIFLSFFAVFLLKFMDF